MTGVSFTKHQCSSGLDLLLLVVCRKGKYTRVETTPDGITALNCHSVLICFQELIIKDDRPLSVVDFLMAMGHKSAIGSFPANVLCCKGLEGVRELSLKRIEDPCIYQSQRSFTHHL
jgi:hypothetical protein